MRERRQPLGQEQRDQSGRQDSVFFILMEKVGSVGRYQTFTFLVLCLIGYMCGGLSLMTPFLFHEDPYHCDNAVGKNCLHYVCKLPIIKRQAFIPDPTIISLSNVFGDYHCGSAVTEVTLIKTVMYGGCLLGFICCFMIGDLIGGKTLMMGGLVINLFGLLKVIITDSLMKAGFGMFFCLFGLTIAYGVSFIFVTQTVGESKRQTYKVALSSSYSLGGLLNVLWFKLVPNYQTVLIIYYLMPTIVAILCFILFFKDTPITLLTKKTSQQALQDLRFIAKINQKDNFRMTIQEVEALQNKYKEEYLDQQDNQGQSFTVLDLFKYKSLRNLITLFIILDCILNLQYFTPTLMLDQFNLSIFVDGTVVQSAQLIAGILSYFLIYHFERRKMAVYCFSVIAVCSLMLVLIWDQNGKSDSSLLKNIIVLLFIFVIEFAISNEFNFYTVYMNQVLPTQVRIIAIGFIKTFGSVAVMLTPAALNLCISSGFPIMLLFAVLAAMSAWISLKLPQTFGMRPAEVIEELKQEKRRLREEKQIFQG